jgi:hypothetical protein
VELVVTKCPDCGEKEAGYTHCSRKRDRAIFLLAIGGILLGIVSFLVLYWLG